MKADKKSFSLSNFVSTKLSFLDLEAKKKLEDSRDIVSFTTNRVTTAPRKFVYSYIILGVLICFCVFYALLFLLKPVKESSELKINRDNFVELVETPSKLDNKFLMTIPVAVKWNNEFFFFDKPNAQGKYEVKLANKEGLHKFYFYAYKGSIFERYISEKPVLITKEFDYTTPSLDNVKVADKHKSLSSNFSFESDEESPMITFLAKDKTTIVYNPKETFIKNQCKQEKLINSNKIKYTCPITFEKEETYAFSAWMVDKVDNKVVIVDNKTVAYIEPLKVDCTQPFSKVRTDTVSIKCKSNRATTYSINKGTKDSIEKDVEKFISIPLDVGAANEKEYTFILAFDDPNGTPIELSYKVVKDNTSPAAELNASITKTGNVFTLTSSLGGLTESSQVELTFDQYTSPNPNWYFKYPEGKTINLGGGEAATFTNTSNEFKLCSKDPITNSETCSGAYLPSVVNYNFKITDDVGNLSNYQCLFNLSGVSSADCKKF
jgi:hypothetical protein